MAFVPITSHVNDQQHSDTTRPCFCIEIFLLMQKSWVIREGAPSPFGKMNKIVVQNVICVMMTLGERMKRAIAAVFAIPPIIPVLADLAFDGIY